MKFICLFVCPELIEELAKATAFKFGMRVEDVLLFYLFQQLNSAQISVDKDNKHKTADTKSKVQHKKRHPSLKSFQAVSYHLFR